VPMLDRYRHFSARPGSMLGAASDPVHHHDTGSLLRIALSLPQRAGSLLRIAGSLLRIAGSLLRMLGGGEGSRSATLVLGWRCVVVAGGEGQ
jgi:hypothetical protein